MTKDEIKTLENEIKDVTSFPDRKYIEIIREVGFERDRCGRCCTSEFNDHVLLLDDDAERIMNIAGREFLRPAPYFDFCDNLGRFYVMGYALKNRVGGNCIFYSNGKCRRYESRPAICRIYPYMLHREADEEGNIDFRQISGLGGHGLYHSEIDGEKYREIVKEVKKYEKGFLDQKLRFMRKIEEHFRKNNLRHSRHVYDMMMREFEKGKETGVYVFFRGELERETISKQVINLQ